MLSESSEPESTIILRRRTPRPNRSGWARTLEGASKEIEISNQQHKQPGLAPGARGPRQRRCTRGRLGGWLFACALILGLLGLASEVGAQGTAADEASPSDEATAAEGTADADDGFDFEAYENLDPEAAEFEDEEPVFDDVEEETSKYGDIETIVVTGTVSDGASDLATSDSIASFDSTDLSAIGAQDVSDLAKFTPNLEIVTSGATTPTFFIRGVGLNDFNSNSTGAVAIYQDGVAINAPPMQLPSLFDVETVNVLRGPQGSGQARNASAGAIKIYSRKPSGDFGGYLKAEFGNYRYLDLEGAVEAPVYKTMLSSRLAFRFTVRDGTMKNRCAGAPPVSEREPAPTANELRARGLTVTDEPWSQCGEAVGPSTSLTEVRSDMPVGLASRVNNIDTWALRGTILFEPTPDQEWILGLKGSKRDEYARLGQSIGTQGFYCLDGDVSNCGFIGQPSDESRVAGLLGGPQGLNGYQPREIKDRLRELNDCFKGVPGSPNGTCGQAANRAAANDAKIQVANELAAGLDSKPWEGDFNRTGKLRNNTVGGYLSGEIGLFDGTMTLTTVTGYDHYDRTNDLDLDFSPETLFQILTDDRGWQVFEDVKLEGTLGPDEKISWDTGAYMLVEELNVGVFNDLGDNSLFAIGARDYTQNLYSVAGYVNVSRDFWDDFTLDGGFRYNWERKKLDYSLTTGAISEPFTENLDDSWSAPTGTVRLTYRFRADTTVFAKYTRGWKPGTFNATSSLASGVTVANPETIDAYETGFSGSWLDDRFGLSANFFYYEYQDYQLFTAQQFAGGQPEFVILNADGSEVYGAEVDANISPWELGEIGVRFGWLETQFLDFVQLQQKIVTPTGVQEVVNTELVNTGNQVLNAPRFKVSLTGEQGVDFGRWGTLTARYDGIWTDTTYYDATEGRGIPNNDNVQFLPENTIAQEAYWVHNLQLTYLPDSSRFELGLWVRNLTNKAYKNFAFDGSTFNNTSIYFVGDPRTFGGRVTLNF